MSDEHEKRRDHVFAVSGIHQCLSPSLKNSGPLLGIAASKCSIVIKCTDVYAGGLSALFENYFSRSVSQNVRRGVSVEELKKKSAAQLKRVKKA